MTNREIQSYNEMKIPLPKNRRKIRSFGIYEFVEYVFSFLLGKIYLFGAMSPFGISYFAAVFSKQKRSLCFLAVGLGILTAGMGLYAMKYAGALVITCAFGILMEKEFSERRWLYAVTSAGSLVVTGLVFIGFDGFMLYDILYQLLESILAFLSFFAFDRAAGLIRNLKNRHVFEPVETLSLLLLSSVSVISLGLVPYLQGISHVISLLIIFITGMTCGFSMACTAGVVLGLVNSLVDVLPAQVVAVYAVSSLCAGLLQKKGRIGVILGFFIANSVAVLYFNASSNNVVAFYYVLAAGVILCMIPDYFLSLFGQLVKAPDLAEDSVLRAREIMEDKLTEASKSFAALSSAFNDAVESRVNAEMRDPGLLFDKTANCVCRDCSLMKYCWQKEYNDTKKSLLTLYNRMEHRGTATIEDVPELFKNECIRLDAFLLNLNKHYELHKINQMWAGRVSESRSLVTEQFNNMSMVLEHLKKQMSLEPDESIVLERRIMAALDRKGIEAERVRVTGQENLEVMLALSDGVEENKNLQHLTEIVSRAVEVPMVRLPSVRRGEDNRIKFVEKTRFSVAVGFAQVAGENGIVCGDHHMFSLSGEGRYILALSDGMGQGDDAEKQSNMTVHLIRQLLAAGFDKETALRLINSMLMVSTERESFATADLCLVNLYSGALEFIKIGASSSYVKNREGVERVSCTSLPAGIVRNVEADCDLKFAKDGDYVVMVTDGVSDILEHSGSDRLQKLIDDFSGETPQQLADEILRFALQMAGGQAKDDMTVLAARMSAA
ncbi:MAG: SpoIIE family protein phosphatase [Clostridia bacterium]|nr:SpoIIE family protein phosphatase [Clostridia bacterium]